MTIIHKKKIIKQKIITSPPLPTLFPSKKSLWLDINRYSNIRLNKKLFLPCVCVMCLLNIKHRSKNKYALLALQTIYKERLVN